MFVRYGVYFCATVPVACASGWIFFYFYLCVDAKEEEDHAVVLMVSVRRKPFFSRILDRVE